MNSRRSEYLDKIVDFLLQDTKLDYTVGLWKSPFLPSPRHYSGFDYMKHPPSTLYIYLKDIYGLTENETEYVWNGYKNILLDKFNNGNNPINESVDNKKRYLDKVVDFIVQDTVIDYGFEFIIPPFSGQYSSSYSFYTFVYPFWDLDMDITPDLFPRSFMVFRDYVNEEYGLTEEESKRVWDYYWEKIYTTIRKYFKPINESVDRKSEYLDKIVNYLVDDTKIEVVSKKWNPPFMTIWLERSRLFSHNVPHAGIFHRFYEYCKETYGLSDDEMMGVWNKYTKSLIYKLRDF